MCVQRRLGGPPGAARDDDDDDDEVQTSRPGHVVVVVVVFGRAATPSPVRTGVNHTDSTRVRKGRSVAAAAAAVIRAR